MQKEPLHRDWVKLYVKECLIGSMREEMTPEERSVWYDFLVLAGNSRVPGVICANENQGFSTKRIAQLLNSPESLIKKCIKAWNGDRIKVDLAGRILLINWEKYQYTDYDRQKNYRGTKRKKPFAESMLEGEDVQLTEISPDTWAVKNSDDLIKVKGQHPSGSLIVEIEPH